MNRDFQGGGGSRVSARIHLPSGLVTFLFTDIEGSTRLAQMLGDGLPAGAQRAPAGPSARPVRQRRRRAVHRGRLVLRRLPRRRRGAGRLRRRRSGRWPSTSGRPPRRRRGSGWACTPATPSRTAASTRARRCTAPPASPPPRTAGRSSVRPPPRGTPRRLPGRRAALLDLGLHRLRGFDGRERLFQLVAPGLTGSSRGRVRPTRRRTTCRPRSTPFVGRGRRARRAARAAVGAPAGDRRGRGRRGQDPAGRRAGRASSSTPTRTASGSSTSPRSPTRAWSRSPSPRCSACAPSRAARSSTPSSSTPPAAGCCCCSTPATRSWARRAAVVARLLGRRRAACGCWRPAGSRSACRARWCGGSRRCRWPAGRRWSERRGGAAGRAHRRGPRRPPGRRRRARPPGPGGRPAGRAAAGDRAGRGPAAGAVRGQLAERLDDVLGTLDAGRPVPEEPAALTLRGAVTEAGAASSRRPAPRAAAPAARHHAGHGRPGRTARWARGRPGCCAGCRSSPGRSTWPAVEWLLDDDPLDPLAVLVDKSLVQAEAAPTGTTYRMLDPIRAYAARRLAEAGEERAGPRPARRLVAARVAARRTWGPEGRPVTLSLYALDPLADELRAALRWTATRRQRPVRPAAGRRARPVVARARPGPRGPAVAVPAVRPDRGDRRADPRRRAGGGVPPALAARRRRR